MEEASKSLRGTMPWTQVNNPNGVIQVFDRQGKEVSLLLIIDLIISMSRKLATNEA